MFTIEVILATQKPPACVLTCNLYPIAAASPRPSCYLCWSCFCYLCLQVCDLSLVNCSCFSCLLQSLLRLEGIRIDGAQDLASPPGLPHADHSSRHELGAQIWLGIITCGLDQTTSVVLTLVEWCEGIYLQKASRAPPKLRCGL